MAFVSKYCSCIFNKNTKNKYCFLPIICCEVGTCWLARSIPAWKSIFFLYLRISFSFLQNVVSHKVELYWTLLNSTELYWKVDDWWAFNDAYTNISIRYILWLWVADFTPLLSFKKSLKTLNLAIHKGTRRGLVSPPRGGGWDAGRLHPILVPYENYLNSKQKQSLVLNICNFGTKSY